MARVSFADLSSDDLDSSDESIFSDASDSDEEISFGEKKGFAITRINPVSMRNDHLGFIDTGYLRRKW